MSLVHLHLLLNHVPVIGLPLGLALLAFGFLRRSRDVLIAALGVIAVVGLVSIPVFFTGEPAEQAVETKAGVSEATIETHEEAAELAFVFVTATAVVALGTLGLVMRGSPLAGKAMAAVAVIGLVTTILFARTANLGGRIAHEAEITGTPPPTGAVSH